MKLKVQQEDLYQGIQTANKAVSSKTTLPILSGLLIETQENQIKLVGTDLEIGIECFVEAEIISEGAIVLPAKYLTSIIRELPKEEIILTSEESNNTAQIKCGNSQFNIHGSPTDEFPLLPEVESGVNFSLNQEKLKAIINQIEFAVSDDESKPFLNGGLMIIENQNIKVAATDTYRLAYREDELEVEGLEVDEIIIPSKTLSELSKLLSDEEDEVKISITENQALFNFSGISIVSRLIEGQFPNYKQVIPDQNNTTARVNKDRLLSATKRAALLAKQDSNIIKVNLKSDKLIITANTPEVGQAYEEVPIDLEGEETEIAFNARYLIDCLKVISDEEVNLELSGSLSPGVIKTTSEYNYTYVIMPVRSA
ncbi:MAG: DNA polymerase III subunit beta [Halanaerobacter sp.]